MSLLLGDRVTATLRRLQEAGTPLRIEPREEDDWCVIDTEIPAAHLAIRLSQELPGQWWISGGNLTCVNGSDRCWVTSPDAVAPIRSAKAVAEGFGLKCGYSIGSSARALLKFVGPPMHRESTRERLLNDIELGYHDCEPGQYSRAVQYDVSACYYSLLTRLPSLRVSITRYGLVWHQMTADEHSRWADLRSVLAGAKHLRNCLWGCALGREEAGVFFHKGETRHAPKRPGPFRATALLVGRSAWELCRLASEECESVYSMTDSVATLSGVKPSAWSSVGLHVGVRAVGSADICSRNVYQIGEKDTHYYRLGSRLRMRAERPAMPSEMWYPSWL